MAIGITARHMADTIRGLVLVIAMARDTIPAIIAIVVSIVRTDGGMIHAAHGASEMMLMQGLPFKDQFSDPSRPAGQSSLVLLLPEETREAILNIRTVCVLLRESRRTEPGLLNM